MVDVCLTLVVTETGIPQAERYLVAAWAFRKQRAMLIQQFIFRPFIVFRLPKPKAETEHQFLELQFPDMIE